MESKREQKGILDPILARIEMLDLDFSNEDIALMEHVWDNAGSTYEGFVNILTDKTIRYSDNTVLDATKKSKMLDFIILCQQLKAVCAGNVFPIILKQIVSKNFPQHDEEILAGNDFPVILEYLLKDKDDDFLDKLERKIKKIDELAAKIYEPASAISLALSNLQIAIASTWRKAALSMVPNMLPKPDEREDFLHEIAKASQQISQEHLVKVSLNDIDDLNVKEILRDSLLPFTPDEILRRKSIKELQKACEEYQLYIENYLDKYLKKYNDKLYNIYFRDPENLSLRERCLEMSEDFKKPKSGLEQFAKTDEKFGLYLEKYQAVVTLKSTLQHENKTTQQSLREFKKEFNSQTPTLIHKADNIGTKFINLVKKLIRTDLKLKDVRWSDLWRTKGDDFVENVGKTLKKRR